MTGGIIFLRFIITGGVNIFGKLVFIFRPTLNVYQGQYVDEEPFQDTGPRMTCNHNIEFFYCKALWDA